MNWPKQQRLDQSPTSPSGRNAQIPGAHRIPRSRIPRAEDWCEPTPSKYGAQDGHLTRIHPDYHGAFEAYPVEQEPSRAMSQDVESVPQYAIYSISEFNNTYGTLGNGYPPTMSAPDSTWYQGEGAPTAYHDTHIQPRLLQQMPANSSNTVYGTLSDPYAANTNALSHLGAHIHSDGAYPRPTSPSGDLHYCQPSSSYSSQLPEASIGTTPYQDPSSIFMPRSTPGPSAIVQDTPIIRLDPLNTEPWSALSVLSGSQNTRYAMQTQVGVEQDLSDTTRSMSSYDDPGSVSSMPNGFETPMLPTQPRKTALDTSSRHLYFPQLSASASQMHNPTSSNSTSLNSLSGTGHTARSGFTSQHRHRLDVESEGTSMKRRHSRKYTPSKPSRQLPLPFVRRLSSASSHTTEATSSSAISDPTAAVLKCDTPGCEASFTGKYGKGNLSRHCRQYHRNKSLPTCEDINCTKSFNRKDALLKHYRSCHPDLAAGRPYLPRLERRNLVVEGANDDA
jgi:hypothetical protein